MRIRALASSLIIAPGLVLAGGVMTPAAACVVGCGSDGDGSADSGGQTVVVQVTGSFVGSGSGGSGGSGGSTTVTVSPPCYFERGMNGKDFFEFWYPGGADEPPTEFTGPPEADGERTTDTVPPGVKKHRKDADGHWYHPACVGKGFDSFDEFVDHAQAYMDAHDWTFVPAGGTPPTPPIPPALLLQAAQEALTVPDPQFEWNPKRNEDLGTLVNLPTWFWLDPSMPTKGSVTATAGPSTATVQVGLSSVTFASDAGSVTCPDGGTAWSVGASSSCTLAFGQPGNHTVTAETSWEGSWSYNGVPQGEVDPLTASWSTGLAVSQVQSLVTNVGR